MCELFLSPLFKMGFSYILQFSLLLHLCRSSTDKFPLDTDSEQIVNHLQEIYAQVVIQQCCYYSHIVILTCDMQRSQSISISSINVKGAFKKERNKICVFMEQS